MSLLPRERILDATDIVALIGERIPLKRAGKEFVGLCPFHNDKKPSLNVSPAKGIFKCFACGAGGDAIKFVQLYEKIEFKEALLYLAERAGLGHVREGPGTERGGAGVDRDQLRSVMAWASQHFQRNVRDTSGGRAAYEYARGRGLTAETIESFHIGYAPDQWDDLFLAARRAGLTEDVLEAAGLLTRNEAGRVYDRFRHRLIFPIQDQFGRPIAFGGRALGDDPAKYLNSPESALFSKARVLYGFDLAKKAFATEKSAIVVEGYIDAVMLAQAGHGQVVATLGTALTDSHVKLLSPYIERLFLCFDGDSAGQKAADRACEVALRSGLDVRVVTLPQGQDPADLVAKDDKIFNKNLHDAKSALHFKWQQTRNEFDAAGPTGQRAAVNAFLEFVARLTEARGMDPVQQGLLVGQLAELLELPTEPVYEMLANARRSQRRPRSPVAAPPVSSVAGPSPDGRPVLDESGGLDLSEGLVRSVEELLGLLVRSTGCMHRVDDVVLRGFGLARPWQELYDQMLNLLDERGAYTAEDVVTRCDEAGLLELTFRLDLQGFAEEDPLESFSQARNRLAAELELQACGREARILRTVVDDAQANEAFLRLINKPASPDADAVSGQAAVWLIRKGPAA